MGRDFTKHGLTNPPPNGGPFSEWSGDCFWLIFEKLGKLANGQERVNRLWTWAKVSLGACSVISVMLGILLLWKRILA